MALKILHIAASYKPAYIYGGPIMSVSALCEALSEKDVSVEVFTTTANGKNELLVQPGTIHAVDGVKVRYFKRITKDHTHFSPSLLKALRTRIAEFDAVHIHAWWNTVSVLAAFIAIKNGIRVVLSPRGMLSAYSFGNRNNLKKKLIHNIIGKSLLQQCHLHATAQSEAVAISKIIKPLSITVIPNFVKLPHHVTARVAQEPLSPLKLLFFSRIEEKKGLDVLLKALPHLNFQFTLTIAGTGEQDYVNYLKSLIVDEAVAEKINWTGFIANDKFELLSSHHLMVLPSHDENFGNVIIESLSVGTPVFISNKVGLADYVADNKLGWVYQHHNDLAVSLNDIQYTFSGEFERIATIAPGIVRHDFDTNYLVKQYSRFYERLLSE